MRLSQKPAKFKSDACAPRSGPRFHPMGMAMARPPVGFSGHPMFGFEGAPQEQEPPPSDETDESALQLTGDKRQISKEVTVGQKLTGEELKRQIIKEVTFDKISEVEVSRRRKIPVPTIKRMVKEAQAPESVKTKGPSSTATPDEPLTGERLKQQVRHALGVTK